MNPATETVLRFSLFFSTVVLANTTVHKAGVCKKVSSGSFLGLCKFLKCKHSEWNKNPVQNFPLENMVHPVPSFKLQ